MRLDIKKFAAIFFAAIVFGVGCGSKESIGEENSKFDNHPQLNHPLIEKIEPVPVLVEPVVVDMPVPLPIYYPAFGGGGGRPRPAKGSLTLVKTGKLDTEFIADATISYTITVTNTGMLPLSNILVTDQLIEGILDCGDGLGDNIIETLAIGAFAECTASYTITAEDVRAGSITNTATAESVDGGTSSDTVVILVPENASLSLLKTSNVETFLVGTQLTYIFTAMNTGNVTLTNVVLTDNTAAFNGAGTISSLNCLPAQPATLAAGETLGCTATYTPPPGDFELGNLHNEASVSGLAPSNTTVTETAFLDIPEGLPPAPSISLLKTANTGTFQQGVPYTYTYTTENTGNVALTSVEITEIGFSGSNGTPNLVCNPIAPATLAPGDQMVCTASYTPNAQDVSQTPVENIGVVNALDPSENPVFASDTLDICVDGAEIFLDVGADTPVAFEGNGFQYRFTVTNSGVGSLTVNDFPSVIFSGNGPLSSIVCNRTLPATLTPNDAMSCTATYTPNAADRTHGTLNLSATVSALNPCSMLVSSYGSSSLTVLPPF